MFMIPATSTYPSIQTEFAEGFRLGLSIFITLVSVVLGFAFPLVLCDFIFNPSFFDEFKQRREQQRGEARIAEMTRARQRATEEDRKKMKTIQPMNAAAGQSTCPVHGTPIPTPVDSLR
ncbi:Oidioi.mRNA.OKI2018_I69.XSR.g16515.t1.cds [Oikopleura dioica]|uniref:Oidioi.mRNA.OKI2018_I69.XSR.g16515.t1.cds n=1 Tax=Oikopleura dioica TaxID=34765 RepID=A0ABN7SI66_OIKDI|nr:Oidioi.mRNA.OKI2018_I69.XSR.g16515.t1.cds [Oikopleura dioica]